jgi:hypothetical protein
VARRQGDERRDSLDAGSGEKLTILLLWFLEYARLTAQLTATTRSLNVVNPGRGGRDGPAGAVSGTGDGAD